MKQFSGYEAKKAVTRENLPVGGYVAKILNAEEISYSWGHRGGPIQGFLC